jgi:hypothetical protein
LGLALFVLSPQINAQQYSKNSQANPDIERHGYVFEDYGMFSLWHLDGPEGKIRSVDLRPFAIYVCPPAWVIRVAHVEKGIIVRSRFENHFIGLV